jgi:hypothetical protein
MGATVKTAGNETVVLAPTGMLGAGISRTLLRRGLAEGAHAIGVDSGSTDSGPSYLARGVSKMNREAIKHDLTVLISEAQQAGVPLMIGSCGTAGTDAGVDWTAAIAAEVAGELGLKPKIALLYSEIAADVLKAKRAAGKVVPLAPAGALSDADIDACRHIVGLMGPEPFMAALERGAEIVLGGRATDTAVLAAAPLMRGAGSGPAWHAAKVAECGGLCTVNPRDGGVLVRVGGEAFEVEPLSVANRCTPHTVSAHMLYENSDPFRLIEPGGTLDVTEADYVQADERITRVTGSRWQAAPYTMKLEGAAAGANQTLMFIGIEDPEVLANLDTFHDRLHAALTERIQRDFGAEAGVFDVSLRLYGWNGVSGVRPPKDTPPPREVGVMFVVTAATQDLADRMAKSCNPYFFHFPLQPGIELPSYAFPFTPAEISRGPVYEFMLNHVVQVESPHELVRTAWLDLEGARVGASAHG